MSVNESEPSIALGDARLQFFLEHQELIRDWAALAAVAQGAADEQLRELRGDLMNDNRVVELGIRVAPGMKGDVVTGSVLHRPAWCVDAEGVPDVGITLGWDSKVDPAGVWPKTSVPYIGVLCSRQTNPGRAIEARLRATTASHLNDKPKYQKGSVHVVYRYLNPDKDWWQDIPKWRQGLVDELLAAWTRWAELVDDAVAGER